MAHDFDSVVSIGGRSLADGILRLFSPGLRAVPTQLPIAIRGLTDGSILVRSVTPLPLDREGLPVKVKFDAIGHVTLSGIGSLREVSLPLGAMSFDLPIAPLIQAIRIPAESIPVDIHLTLNPQTGALVGDVSQHLSVPVSARGLDVVPDASHLTARLNLPTVTSLSIPVPVPLSVPVKLTSQPIEATLTFPLSVAGSIDESTGCGLLLGLGAPSVALPSSGWPTASSLQRQLRNALQVAIRTIAPSLDDSTVQRVAGDATTFARPPGLGGPSTPTVLQTIGTDLRSEVSSALTGAFQAVGTRTGRLVFPLASQDAPCEAAVLPTDGRAAVASFPRRWDFSVWWWSLRTCSPTSSTGRSIRCSIPLAISCRRRRSHRRFSKPSERSSHVCSRSTT
jgi:hypothetical protein